MFTPDRLVVEKAKLNPTIAGNSFGSVEFKTVKPGFGQQIDAVASEIMRLVSEIMAYRGSAHIELHFDELISASRSSSGIENFSSSGWFLQFRVFWRWSKCKAARSTLHLSAAGSLGLVHFFGP